MPDKTYSFLIPLSVTVSANAQGTLIYVVPQTAILTIKGWIWKSTDTFAVVSIQDNTGIQFTNAIINTPIDSDFLPKKDTPNDVMYNFPLEIELDGGKSLNIGVLDTSGSGNTIQAMLYGIQKYL